MANILNIEASTTVCSVAIAEDEKLLAVKELDDGYSHAEKLLTFIKEVLDESHLTIQDINAIAISKGPGSYTGLRIGTATAKGLCYGQSIPLIAVDTLKAMATGTAQETKGDGWYCPMIDARRMEVYAGIYDATGKEIRGVQADIVEENTYQEWLDQQTVYFFGNGAEKCKETLSGHPHAHFIEGFPSAKHMVKASLEKYKAGDFEDTAYFEPFYLKDFVAKPAKPLFD